MEARGQIQLPLSSTRPILLADMAGAYPAFFIWGPMVFSTVSMQYTGSSSGRNASFLGPPVMTRFFEPPAFAGAEIVVVSSPFFPHKLATGYGSPAGRVVTAVNGVKVKNLRHLVQVLRDANEEFITFEFAGHGSEDLVFPRKETVAATEADNGIRAQGSTDALEVWSAR